MNTTEVPSGSIVVAYDGSPHAERALAWALQQAMLEHREVDLVHALGPAETQAVGWSGAAADTVLEALSARGRDMVQEATARAARMQESVAIRGHVLHADPRQLLHDLSSRAHAIVVGSRGRGSVRTLLLGSVSAAVSAHAECPVVVARPGKDATAEDADAPAPAPDGVVVAADGTAESLPVVEFAFHNAALRSLPVTVVHYGAGDVWGPPDLDPTEAGELEAMLTQTVATMAEKYPDLAVTRRLEQGAVRRLLPGRDWDLIVVGRHDKTRWDRILSGSTAQIVLHHATTTVAVIPEASPRDDT